MTKKHILLMLAPFMGQAFFAQTESEKPKIDLGSISGNIQTVAQIYNDDTLINAAQPEHKMGLNSFANINYRRGNFSAGVRYESYLNTLEGYPSTFKGSGLGYRYASWKNEDLDVTIGNFYTQFGSGMILRSYEERQLGLDNALDGVKIEYTPYQGIYLKALAGKQRHQFDDGLQNGNGLIRGFDGELSINELFDSTLADAKLQVRLGGSFVSKFNNDNNTPDYILPKNVGAYGGRIAVDYGKVSFSGEYILKENDPYPDGTDPNFDYLYKNGEGILLNLGFSQKGFAINLSAKHTDNMLWRSTNINVGPTDLLIGYLPALSSQHTYALAGSMYPYATNPRGEVAYQADLFYKIPKKSKLGGKYGMNISVNFATAFAPERTPLNDELTTRKGYKTTPFSASDSTFFKDFNVTIEKKISKKFKLKMKYLNFVFDDRAILVAQNHELIYANIGVVDFTYRINKKNTIRIEAQGLFTEQDQGDWAYGMIEYTFSPHWFVTVLDQYNYGNALPEQRLHYGLLTAGYIKGPHRFELRYGRQRAGVFCVGGVCRQVPASNGFTFTLTSSF